MLIGIFKKGNVFTPVLLILVAILLWIDGFVFFFQHDPDPGNPAPLYQIIVPFVYGFPFLQTLVAWLFLLLQAFLVNHIVASRSLIEKQNLLPALLYIVLMSSSSELLFLNPVLFANFFMLLAINKIFDSYTEKDVAFEVFNLGLLVSVAGLFYTPALWFFLLAIASLFVYQVGNIRGIIATILGFLTPWLFLFVYYFISGSPDSLVEYLPEVADVFLILDHGFSAYFRVFIIFFAFLALISFFRISFSYLNDKPVRIRKRFNILIWFFSVGVLSTITVSGFFEIHYTVMVIPLSIFLSVFFMEIKKRRWSEIIFTLLIILIIIGKVIRFN